MNAVLYYGVPTGSGQTVSEEVRSRGINLLRSNPSSSLPIVTRKATTITYLNYVGQLGAAIKAAELNQWVRPGVNTFYYESSRTTVTPFMRTPAIIWNYSRPMAPEVLSGMRERFNAIETVARGKPAFSAILPISRLRDLVNDTSPEDTTPSSTTSINISTARAYIFLHKLADLLFRVHQYPLVTGGKEGVSNYYTDSLQIEVSHMTPTELVYDKGSEKEYKVFNGRTLDKFRFHMNLKQTNLDDYVYTVSSPSDLTDDGILVFPYIPALARKDTDMIISVIDKYLRPLLADNAKESLEMFTWLKSRIGNLADTTWGDELAHLYSGIGLMLETGATIRIVVTPNNLYQGYCLVGGGYALSQWDQIYEPVPNTRFAEVFNLASPHSSSFEKIIGMINFVEDIDREAARKDCNTCSKLAQLIRTYGISTNDEDRLMREARNLCFPLDEPLPCSGFNLARVLRATSNNDSEEGFPLHPSMIMEKDRRKRLLSAFGAMGPSFLIPGGRSVNLDGNFQYTIVVKGKKEARTTTRMFCQMVPLKKACEDLDLLIQNHTILTPIGTPLAGRASSFSLIREFAGESGVNVLAALRGLCGVTLIESAVDQGKEKRVRDVEDEGSDAKKKRRFGF